MQFIRLGILIILIVLLLFVPRLIYKLLFHGKSSIDTKQFCSSSMFKPAHTFIITSASYLTYCNICHRLSSSYFWNCFSYVPLFSWIFPQEILQCCKCGVVAHATCLKWKIKKKKALRCKETIRAQTTKFNQHQFIEGNLPFDSVCVVCQMLCGSYYELESLICLWCQRVCHKQCLSKLQEQCDLGPLHDFVIPPSAFELTSNDQLALTQLFKTSFTQSPLFVLINPKSGGQIGAELMFNFYQYLNPIQIINVLEKPSRLQALLPLFNQFQTKPNLLICGGDGTVATCINILKESNFYQGDGNNPAVGIIPLGTGNDLSRALGWGISWNGGDVGRVIKGMKRTKKVMLDRWEVNCSYKKEFLYCYFGIGLDAKVCLDFHRSRDKYPYLFKTRIGNKFFYGQIGFSDMVFGKRASLAKTIEIECDGEKIQFPDIVTFLFINIHNIFQESIIVQNITQLNYILFHYFQLGRRCVQYMGEQLAAVKKKYW